MPRRLKVAAAQLGPIHREDSRESAVERMVSLLRDASDCGASLAQVPLFVDFPDMDGVQVLPPSVDIFNSNVCDVGEVRVTVTAVFIVWSPIFDTVSQFQALPTFFPVAVKAGYADCTA
jgi:hypothetical protein